MFLWEEEGGGGGGGVEKGSIGNEWVKKLKWLILTKCSNISCITSEQSIIIRFYQPVLFCTKFISKFYLENIKRGVIQKVHHLQNVFFQELSSTPMSHFVIFPQPHFLLFHSLKNDTEQKIFLYIKLLKHYNIKGNKKSQKLQFQLMWALIFIHRQHTYVLKSYAVKFFFADLVI